MTALPTRGRLTVLVVDDDAIARRLVVATLRSRYDILEASDGLEAVEVFKARSPDVVVMDVEMPKATGSEAAAAMRLLSGARYVPILLVSSLDELSVVVSALSNGADDFLPKPFNPRLFESKLQVFLRLRDMQQALMEKNRELSRFREETEAEQRLAYEVFDRLLRRGGLRDGRVAVKASPLGVLSGDLVAAAELPGGGFRWMLCDVAGHGLSGALGTLPVSTLFSEGSERGLGLEELTARMNAELKAMLPASLFCAAAVLELDARRRQLSVINAGLPDVLVICEHRVRCVGSGCLPLGITSGAAFVPSRVELPVGRGAVVWVMSDGIVEATSTAGEAFGLPRATEALTRLRPVREALGHLESTLRAFTGGPQGDDEAAIGVEV
ncbi:MAG: fused response regulator/phosphatase [Myxococcaceae bacterium]|jgi:CheY-like chemotaxis protein|nr:fused response regulator/phosphatase [Myxococcaceae bacterium]